MADTRIDDFVHDALQRGVDQEQIGSALREAGWMPDQIRKAMAAYAPSSFSVPVPRPSFQASARDTFLYLVMFAMLYLSAVQLGSLIFQFINLGFPDPPTDHYAYQIREIRWAIASLLIAFPVFVTIAWRVQQAVTRDASMRASGPRRWLTYLTLAIAGCVVVGNLISVVYNLLSGELTVRFILKALTVLLIAGAVFLYFRHQTRVDDEALSS